MKQQTRLGFQSLTSNVNSAELPAPALLAPRNLGSTKVYIDLTSAATWSIETLARQS